jgi:bla regulator protein BlaR1
MNAMIAILIAVLDTLWLAVAVAAAVWLTLRWANKINAATRFVIWWVTLGVVLILPAASQFAASARGWLKPAIIASARPLYAPPPGPVTVIELTPLVSVRQTRSGNWIAAAAVFWAMVFLYRMRRLLLGYLQVRGLKTHATGSSETVPRTHRRARVLLSSEVDSPIAVGFVAPAVILPVSLASQLSREEMDQVLLHESAHIARWDDWTTLLSRLLEAVFGLHPVAAWILRRIEMERELACDEWVVARTQSAKRYARCLARLYELRFPEVPGHRALLASGMFSHRSALVGRLEAMLGRGREFTAGVSAVRVSTACGAMLVVVAIAAILPHWIVVAQTPRPAFEVASIKRTPPEVEARNDGVTFAARPGGRLEVVNNPMSNVIQNAYGIAYYQLMGAPDWVTSERYDIEARGAATAGPKQVMLMVQSLLADRFQMKAHFETRQVPAAILTVAKGGAKLQFASPENCVPRDPTKPLAGQENVCGSNLISRDHVWKATRTSMPGVVGALSRMLARPVIDQTGLKGSFDIKLTWSDDLAGADNPDGPPSLITALHETLGLDLKSGHGGLEVLVIDHIERPTAN